MRRLLPTVVPFSLNISSQLVSVLAWDSRRDSACSGLKEEDSVVEQSVWPVE